jgi:hypothetical protein
MTDFLEQLLARSYEPSAAIRPRPRARFEAPEYTNLTAIEHGGLEKLSSSSPPIARPGEREGPLIQQAFERQPSPSRPEMERHSDEPRAALPAKPTISLGERRPLIDRVVNDNQTAYHQTHAESKSMEDSSDRETKPIGAMINTPRQTPDEQSSDRKSPIVIQNITARPTAVNPDGSRYETPVAEPTRSATVARQTTVRVQIGRIEITAPPPPSRPAVVERRPTPTLKPARSLDDYLRRRSGGRE